ncbi:MAG: MoaD/ThiS family protein [Usitatibacter sp.]
MRVLLPTPLAHYTAHRREVEAEGATLGELFRDLDRRYPGIRFRVIDEQEAIRPHIRVFVNRELAPSLARALSPADEVLVVAALSGG